MRIHCRIRRLEDHIEQAANRPAESPRCIHRADLLRANTPVQLGEAFQAMQHIGNAVEQARLVSPTAGLQIHAGKAVNHRFLHKPAIAGQLIKPRAVALLVAAQVNIRKAALPLQGMHQTADPADQFAGQLQAPQAMHFAAPCGQHEFQRASHVVFLPEASTASDK